MNPDRRAYIDSYEALRTLASAPELRATWDTESVLAEFSVRGLAGHLVVRTGWAVLDYLEAPIEPGAEPIEAPEYYMKVLGAMGVEEHKEVRVRGEAAAPEGPEALLAKYDEAVTKLAVLEDIAPDRLVKVFGGHVMRLDDYLVTRIVEILVHADDLALSIGVPVPNFPTDAWDLAHAHLLQVARLRHGDRAVLMAFARRERDPAEALRVF